MSEPILVHHGTADLSFPIEWSQASVAAPQSLGKDAELLTYPGEPHAFEAAWEASMERTIAWSRTCPRSAEYGSGGRQGAVAVVHEQWMSEEIPFLAAQQSWSRATLIVAGTPMMPHDPDTELVVASPVSR